MLDVTIILCLVFFNVNNSVFIHPRVSLAPLLCSMCNKECSAWADVMPSEASQPENDECHPISLMCGI